MALPEETELSDRRLQWLLGVSLPLVARLKHTRNSKPLERHVRDLANALFFDHLFDQIDYLTAPLADVSALVDRAVTNQVMLGFLERYQWEHADLIGFSLLSDSQLPYAMLIARTLRAAYPNTRFAAGGPYITEVLPNLIASGAIFDDFDYLVAHEGESALLSILHELDGGTSLQHPNVFSKTSIRHHRGPFHVEDIEALPVQDFRGLDLDLYRPWEMALPFYSSKGCTWRRCTFCSLNHFISYRERDIPSFVAGIVRSIRGTGVDHVHITDEDIRPARLKMLTQELLREAPSPPRWAIQTRFYPQLDRELLLELKKAGCYSLEFGLESASKSTLRAIRKGISLPVVRRILADCEEVGLEVILNCMVGFPGEDEADAQETISFLDEICTQHPALDLMCNTQLVKVYRHAAFGESPDQFGIDPVASYQLSSIMDWERPSWVSQFVTEHRDHLLFANRSSLDGKSATGRGDQPVAIGNDPRISLSDEWIFLEDGELPAGDEEESPTPSPLLLRLHTNTCQVFRVNETMAAPLKLLTADTHRLSGLKEAMIRQYPGSPESDILDALGTALRSLNNMGVLAFYED